MALDRISERQIVGIFFKRLERNDAMDWIPKITMPFSSDQQSEEYVFLSDTPQMRQWTGGRQLKDFKELTITGTNVPYEASVKVRLKDLRRDKTGQLQMRINELAARSLDHWAELASTLILNGATTISYDGQFFFDTTHQTLNSGLQSNMIDVDISALPIPADEQGSITAPSSRVMKDVIFKSITQMLDFKDSEGKPSNRSANSFHVIAPVSLLDAVAGALNQSVFAAGVDNNLMSTGFNISFSGDPYFSTWTDKIAVFRADSDVPSIILQSEKEINLKIQGAGSQIEFQEDKWQIGVDAERTVVPFEWRNAVLTTMI